MFENIINVNLSDTFSTHSIFSHTHKIGNISIIASFVSPYLQFPSLFAPHDVSKCEIKSQLIIGWFYFKTSRLTYFIGAFHF